MEKSIKTLILEHLKGKDWVWGGKLEDHIRSLVGSKASTASRRARELENEGRIEKRLVLFEGNRVVQYRVKGNVGIPRSMVRPVEANHKLF